ncbi:hypothetical protein ACFYY2_30355 [Streptomyces sp. NPDC001822]|uniref:hypothetical protein n=1 Tax=Streptomyces sp. NPDC001822 TaxID=3364614 RepID=UPI00367FA5BF
MDQQKERRSTDRTPAAHARAGPLRGRAEVQEHAEGRPDPPREGAHHTEEGPLTVCEPQTAQDGGQQVGDEHAGGGHAVHGVTDVHPGSETGRHVGTQGVRRVRAVAGRWLGDQVPQTRGAHDLGRLPVGEPGRALAAQELSGPLVGERDA